MLQAGSFLNPSVESLRESVTHLGCSPESGMPAVQDQVTQIIQDSSSLVTEMKPVVRDSLKNLDKGMLKTLAQFCSEETNTGLENFVVWLNKRDQVDVMLMWMDSMSKVCRYQRDEPVPDGATEQ